MNDTTVDPSGDVETYDVAGIRMSRALAGRHVGRSAGRCENTCAPATCAPCESDATCPAATGTCTSTVTGLQPTQQLKRSLIAESVEAALRRAHAPAHHRTEIAPPCRTITRL